MSAENFMGRIDIERAADQSAVEPYVVIAQTDYDAQDCVQAVRVPISLIGKLVEQLADHTVRVTS